MEDSTGRKGQGEHESPSDAVNAQEPVGLPQQGKPNSNVNLESWLSRDPVDVCAPPLTSKLQADRSLVDRLDTNFGWSL